MLQSFDHSLRRQLCRVSRLLDGRHFRLKLSVLCFISILFFAFPSAHVFTGFEGYFMKSEKLFENLDVGSAGSHLAKLNVRLTVPFLIKVFSLSVYALIALKLLSALLLFFLMATFLETRLHFQKKSVFLATLAFTLTYIGKAGVVQNGSFFDTLSLTLVLAACVMKHGIVQNVIRTALLFLAVLNDERAALTILGFIIIELTSLEGRPNSRSISFTIVSMASMLIFAGFRIYLSSIGITTHLEAVSFDILKSQLNNVPMGYLMFLEGFWIVVIAALVPFGKPSMQYLLQRVSLVLYLFATLLSFIVFDISRSLIYFFPIVFIAFRIVQSRGVQVNLLLRYALLFSFLIPTYYIDGNHNCFWIFPLPVQVVRMIAGLY